MEHTTKDQIDPHILKKYTKDLTKLPEEEGEENLRDWKNETSLLINILLSKTKNRPILVGNTGVGKSNIVRELARRIVKQEVPNALKKCRLLEINTPNFIEDELCLANFKTRFEDILRAIGKLSGDIILFINGIHLIEGTKSWTSSRNLKITELLNPQMLWKNIKIIGSTIPSEYCEYIEKEPILENVCQHVFIEESTVEETILILKKNKEIYENFHKVKITDAAIVAAATLSNKYINKKLLPYKAAELIDDASSISSKLLTPPTNLDVISKLTSTIKNFKSELKLLKKSEGDLERISEIEYTLLPLAKKTLIAEEKKVSDHNLISVEVGVEEIQKLVSHRTKIPIKNLVVKKNDIEIDFLKLKWNMQKTIIGQDLALESISNAIIRSTVGIQNSNKPIGSFLFCGPKGVGKYKTVQVLSKLLFGEEQKIIRVTTNKESTKSKNKVLINEFKEEFHVNYFWQLAEVVKKNPSSIIFLDELDATNPIVLDTILEILYFGIMTDKLGNITNFKNTIIIINIDEDLEPLTKRIKQINNVRPQFISGMDSIIVFNELSKPIIKEIIDINLSKLGLSLKKLFNLNISFSEKVANKVLKDAYDINFGVPPIKKYINQIIETFIAKNILMKLIDCDGRYTVEIENNDFIIVTNNKGLN